MLCLSVFFYVLALFSENLLFNAGSEETAIRAFCRVLWFRGKKLVWAGNVPGQKKEKKDLDTALSNTDVCLETQHKRMSG